MRRFAEKITRLLLFGAFAAIFMSMGVLAHDTMSEFYPNPDKNEGVIQFFYSNDDLMSNLAVTVYDIYGAEIGVGTTDANGLFDFSGFENAGHIIARADDEHIQIHVVAEGGAYVVGKNFGGKFRQQLGNGRVHICSTSTKKSQATLDFFELYFVLSLIYFAL